MLPRGVTDSKVSDDSEETVERTTSIRACSRGDTNSDLRSRGYQYGAIEGQRSRHYEVPLQMLVRRRKRTEDEEVREGERMKRVNKAGQEFNKMEWKGKGRTCHSKCETVQRREWMRRG